MNEQFVKLYTWMTTDLHLVGNELIVFAMIHAYTEWQGGYAGGMEPLMERTGLARSNVYELLNRLKTKGYIGLANASKGRVHSTYVSLVNRPASGTVNEESTVLPTVLPAGHNRPASGTLLDNRYIDTPCSPPKGGSANADARSEAPRRKPRRPKNRALNYMTKGAYTEAALKEMGISMGEEFYDDDYKDSLDEIRYR